MGHTMPEWGSIIGRQVFICPWEIKLEDQMLLEIISPGEQKLLEINNLEIESPNYLKSVVSQ